MLGGTIRKVLTRLHWAAPSLEGRRADTIEERLEEQEMDILPQLLLLDDSLERSQNAD